MTEPRFERRVPDGDGRTRDVCRDCGFVHYLNPKVVVGVVAERDGRILMCRRAIEPRQGFWTLPAGFLELGETTAAGAARECFEEARARVEIDGLLGIHEVPRISQVQIFYHGRLVGADPSPGPESLEVGLFLRREIETLDLAFPSVAWALERWDVRGASGPESA